MDKSVKHVIETGFINIAILVFFLFITELTGFDYLTMLTGTALYLGIAANRRPQ